MPHYSVCLFTFACQDSDQSLAVAWAGRIHYFWVMPVQAKHRFTTADYYRMAEAGVIAPDVRVELLDGEIIDMSPIGPFHGSVTKYLLNYFTKHAQQRWLVTVQDPVHLDDHSEPQPDLMLVRSTSDFYRKRHPGPRDVFLLIEIADTTLTYDREAKLPAYGRSGIPEVWIINLDERVVEIYREANPSGYGSSVIVRPGDSARPLAFADIALPVGELLG